MTETIDCGEGSPVVQKTTAETAFERPRGVYQIEVRPSFAQVHVADLQEPLVSERVRVLQALKDANISIDFLKFTPSGLSFIVPEGSSTAVETALKACGVPHLTKTGRSIVLVYAVNIRDEEGLIPRIVQEAIASGTRVDHIGDGHDRMLLVVAAEDALKLKAHFEEKVI